MRKSSNAVEKVEAYLAEHPEVSKRKACEAVGVAEQTYYKAKSKGKRKGRKETVVTEVIEQTPTSSLDIRSLLKNALLKQIDLNKAAEEVVDSIVSSLK